MPFSGPSYIRVWSTSRINQHLWSTSCEDCHKWSTKGLYCCSVCLSCWWEAPSLHHFKERGGELGPRVKLALTFPNNIKVSASASWWMTSEELHHWIRGVWKESSLRRFLFLDNYRPHSGADNITGWKHGHQHLLCCWRLHRHRPAISINASFKKAPLEKNAGSKETRREIDDSNQAARH